MSKINTQHRPGAGVNMAPWRGAIWQYDDGTGDAVAVYGPPSSLAQRPGEGFLRD